MSVHDATTKAALPAEAKNQFLHDAAEHVRDIDHRSFVRKALGGYYVTRDSQKAKYRDVSSRAQRSQSEIHQCFLVR